MSEDNSLIWGRVTDFFNRYMIFDNNGDIVPDLESRVIVRRALIALLRFFYENNLLKIDPFDANGNLIDREYRFSDFTSEGIELIKRKEGAWHDSKGSRKDPPDMKILAKELAKIREGEVAKSVR